MPAALPMMLCNPFLILNMGGEMLYILEQRLGAQNVPKEKSSQVLQDLIGAMFNTNFINKIFQPQELYTNASLKLIFKRIAHSSIMKLNDTSMNRLYELMLMGFKYQLLLCTQLKDLMHVTMNHLNSIRAMARSHSASEALVDDTIHRIVATYGVSGNSTFFRLRQGLCRFLQDAKIRISLFLQEEIQRPDSAEIIIYLPNRLPVGTEVPGAIKYFDSEGKVSGEATVEMESAKLLVDPKNARPFRRISQLGLNMYSTPPTHSNGSADDTSSPHANTASGLKASRTTAKAEANMLAQLIGKPSSVSGFKMNLMQDSLLLSDFKHSDDPVFTVDTIAVDFNGCSRQIADIMSDLSVSTTEAAPVAREENELLSLIDDA